MKLRFNMFAILYRSGFLRKVMSWITPNVYVHVHYFDFISIILFSKSYIKRFNIPAEAAAIYVVIVFFNCF